MLGRTGPSASRPVDEAPSLTPIVEGVARSKTVVKAAARNDAIQRRDRLILREAQTPVRGATTDGQIGASEHWPQFRQRLHDVDQLPCDPAFRRQALRLVLAGEKSGRVLARRRVLEARHERIVGHFLRRRGVRRLLPRAPGQRKRLLRRKIREQCVPCRFRPFRVDRAELTSCAGAHVAIVVLEKPAYPGNRLAGSQRGPERLDRGGSFGRRHNRPRLFRGTAAAISSNNPNSPLLPAPSFSPLRQTARAGARWSSRHNCQRLIAALRISAAPPVRLPVDRRDPCRRQFAFADCGRSDNRQTP